MRKRSIISICLAVAFALTGMLTACSGQSIQINQPASVTKDIKAASGGSISNGHGATLTIPANALSGDAHVTLADTGQPNHAKSDPLSYISDSFSVTATPSAGNAVITLVNPATLQITTHPAKKGQDIITAEALGDSLGAVHLHYSTGTNGNTISARYSNLGAIDWGVLVPLLPRQPTPTEGSVLQVPWYDQSGLPWCVPTSLTEMLRYYDFSEAAGDPLNATFGQSTALANWETAGQNHQPAGSGAGYDETNNIGLQNYNHSDPGGSGARMLTYLWDDDFFFTAPGDTPASQDLNHLDFETYVTLVNIGVFGLADRKPLAMIVDTWWHSVVIVGVDGTGVFLHNSNGGIAVHMNWTDLANQARQYNIDDKGKPYEVHTLWTGVVDNLPVKPLEKREGSVVIARGDLSFNDSASNTVTLDWDGSGSHTAGYFFNDSGDTSANSYPHGTYAYRNAPLTYRYRVANVSNIPLTFHTVAELSGANYGDGITRQGHDVTVPPYSVSDYINGSFTGFPAGASAIFDVRLVETNAPATNQDVKFVRIDIRDASSAPLVHITAPFPNSHVPVNVPFTLAGSVSEASGQQLPSTSIVWTANDRPIGTGATLTTTLTTPGTYTIVLTATDGFGQKGSATLTLIADAPTPKPTVSITAPTNGQIFYGVTSGGQVLTLTGAGSSGVTSFLWSDSIQGNLGTGTSLPTTLSLQDVGNCDPPTSHVLTLTGTDGTGQKATSQITITLEPLCIK